MSDASSTLEEFAARAQTIARQSYVDRAAVAVVGAMERAGIESLVLKGPALARMLYNPREHRGYFDIDLLVAARNRVGAGRVLASIGYIDFVKNSGLHLFPDDPHADLWTRASAVGSIAVDLHWRVPGCHEDPDRVWEVLRARRRWVAVEGFQLPILDRAGLALHLALHAAQHGLEDRKALGDLARGVDRWPFTVWREAAALASEVGAQDAFSAGLGLLPRGLKLSNEVGLPVRAPHQPIADRVLRPRGAFHLQAFIEADGLRGRTSVLRWSIFPDRNWITLQRAWASRSRVHLATAYALHLARAPWWAMRAWWSRGQPGRTRRSIRKGT